MDLTAYARRVGLEACRLRPNLETLRALHVGHLQNIPFENLDVHLGHTMGLATDAAFEKLVGRHRGGWCYEMNGLHGWALEAIGFRVMRMAGAVLRSQRGESSLGRHLMLHVELDQAYLVDVGLGDGLIEPMPIAEGEHVQGNRRFRLERLEDRWWRFHNHGSAFPQNVDFRLEPANEQLLQEQCVHAADRAKFAICAQHRVPTSSPRKIRIHGWSRPKGLHRGGCDRANNFLSRRIRAPRWLTRLDCACPRRLSCGRRSNDTMYRCSEDEVCSPVARCIPKHKVARRIRARTLALRQGIWSCLN